MNKISGIRAMLLSGTAMIVLLGMGLRGSAQRAPFSDTTLLFNPDTDGYTLMHVPALTLSKRGVLLAFSEGRLGNGKDWAEMDLLMRRSLDKGKTWEPFRVIVPHAQGKPTSNITPIADQDGTIHLLFQVNYANAYYIRSVDDGKTWSAPVDMTEVFDQFKPDYNWKVLAPGPGHAIQLKNGRLVVPVWMCIPDRSKPGGDHRPSCVATIYSDDHAKTWKRGQIVANNKDLSAKGAMTGDLPGGGAVDTIINPNESVVVELPDGRVMINMRNESLLNRRLISTSPDGFSHWTKPVYDTALFEPVCMASLVRMPVDQQGRTRMLFVNPDSRNNPVVLKMGSRSVNRPRENLTAKMSYDGGKTWPVAKVLHASGAGYSDLAVGADGTIYCLYEVREGPDSNWKYRVLIHRFDVEWLTDGKDSFK